jgi:hypothetical protein
MDIITDHLPTTILIFLLTSGFWYGILKIYGFMLRRNLKREMYAAAPMSAEELEARIYMEKARADVTIAQKELKMAELRQSIAEYHAKVADQMTRMDVMNHEMELLRLELSVKKLKESTTETVASE